MDAILHSLNAWRESTEFTVALPYMRLAALMLLGLCYPVAVCIQRGDLHAALRQAIADAGLSEKQVAGTHSKSLLSMRLSGQKPVTFDTLSQMPVEVVQWFLVRAACSVGVPHAVIVGARLHRRQARMALHAAQKAGIA